MNYGISNFWTRIAAMIIDGIILGAFGFLISMPFSDFFVSLGSNGIFFGFFISLFYFSIMNSKIGKGQTVGKIAMKIKVVDREGNYISLEKSLLRNFILIIPFLFVNYKLPGTAEDSIYSLIKIQMFFYLIIGIILIYILNKSTRQTLHDFAVNTFVVNSTRLENTQELKKIRLYPFYIYGIVIVFFISLTIYNFSKQKPQMKDVTVIHKELQKIDGVINASASRNTRTFYGNNEKNTTEFFVGTLFVKELPKNYSEFEQLEVVKEAVRIIINQYSEKEKLDNITIHLVRGYNIGIARSNRSYSNSKTPEEWMEIIEK